MNRASDTENKGGTYSMKAWLLGGIIKIQGCFKEKRTHFFLGFPIKSELHSEFSLCHGKTGAIEVCLVQRSAEK